ncbi:META domain-containing protein [Actinokineospora diospyrosa]|uniref:Heat shock protein HslJ n=1 Tax=Actinokineospora diospyrosa TaxID=103728 RepID=A0ABT1ILJ1_9PSEU|nr:META domain-containing protein [Actinokineospora diospyrosa]MCP2273524.1 Heat shock protein HslJ [Actinokineospora diospyrosa]
MRTRLLTSTLVALLALAGCAQGGTTPANQGESPQSGPTPSGKTFTANSASDKGTPHALVPGSSVSLNFHEDGRLTANAGCNTIGGTVSFSGGTLQPGELSITEMACDAPLHDQDQWLAKLLEAKPTWRLDGDKLTLASAETELVLTEPKKAALAGPTWTVESLLVGETAASNPAAGQASLTFAADRVNIQTGCNSGSATYTAAGSTLKFEPPLLTKMACADGSSEVENAIVAALGQATEYSIEGQTLTLTNGDKGLRLRASS